MATAHGPCIQAYIVLSLMKISEIWYRNTLLTHLQIIHEKMYVLTITSRTWRRCANLRLCTTSLM
jgi:hypothetical protein